MDVIFVHNDKRIAASPGARKMRQATLDLVLSVGPLLTARSVQGLLVNSVIQFHPSAEWRTIPLGV